MHLLIYAKEIVLGNQTETFYINLVFYAPWDNYILVQAFTWPLLTLTFFFLLLLLLCALLFTHFGDTQEADFLWVLKMLTQLEGIC